MFTRKADSAETAGSSGAPAYEHPALARTGLLRRIRERVRPPMPLRLLLIGLSVGGMIAAGVLLAVGHLLWAAQVLAGVVLATFLILLVV